VFARAFLVKDLKIFSLTNKTKKQTNNTPPLKKKKKTWLEMGP
jgi:hypothetical protein